jgi:hypothetical protein
MPGLSPTKLRGVFFYPLQMVLTGTLNAELQSQQVFIQDADFEVTNINYVSTGNFSIIFGTGNVLFMRDYVRHLNVLGTALLPHFFKPPILFPAGSAISVKLRNDTGSQNTVDLLFEGTLK